MQFMSYHGKRRTQDTSPQHKLDLFDFASKFQGVKYPSSQKSETKPLGIGEVSGNFQHATFQAMRYLNFSSPTALDQAEEKHPGKLMAFNLKKFPFEERKLKQTFIFGLPNVKCLGKHPHILQA